MKTNLFALSFLAAMLSSLSLKAQDSAAPAAAASAHASAAAEASTAAVAASAVTGIRITSGVAAIPVWMIGGSAAVVGSAATHVGNGLWDAAQPANGPRPKLNRQAGVPIPPPRDPSPAAAMKTVPTP